MDNDASYWNLSRSPYYSFIFTLPLFAVYEIMVLFLSRDQMATLRNGADVLMRQLLALFGAWGAYALSVAFIIGFMVVFLFQKKNWSITAIRSEYLLKMLLEGTLWGFLLYVMLKYAPVLLMFPSGKILAQHIILSIGAGLYEEFVFRVVAIALISQLLKFIFLWKRVWRIPAAIFISACLFSGFHFVGAFGEPLNLTLFFYRLFAGVLLGSLYVARGFGITAYAHMVYDFVVVFNLTTNS